MSSDDSVVESLESSIVVGEVIFHGYLLHQDRDNNLGPTEAFP